MREEYLIAQARFTGQNRRRTRVCLLNSAPDREQIRRGHAGSDLDTPRRDRIL